MPRLPRALRALLTATAALVLALPALAAAAPVSIVSEPLTVSVGERGQLQAVRTGDAGGMFFPPASPLGDAGFFLAFPAGATPAPPEPVAGQVFGFGGGAGPKALREYTLGGQGAVTGTGLASDPLRQQTIYGVPEVALITQTTTYVTGAESFTVRWDVRNVTAAPLAFKAMLAADFFFEGSDVGTGVYTEGPPRFVGGTNPDTGRSGGFAELPAMSLPWSHYEALPFGSGPDELWGKLQGSAATAEPAFTDAVLGTPADNAGAVEWDQQLTVPLAPGATARFAVSVRSAAPAAVQLTPSRGRGAQGAPLAFTLTALDTAGAPFANRTVRFSIVGPNATSSSAVTDAAGNAVLLDPGLVPGADTLVAFVDFNDNGVRDGSEPQASALATIVDQAAPSCTIRLAGDRRLGARERLVVAVRCGERVTARARATLGGRRLGPASAVAAAGSTARVRLRVPAAIRRRLADRSLAGAVTVVVTDAGGHTAVLRAERRLHVAPPLP